MSNVQEPMQISSDYGESDVESNLEREVSVTSPANEDHDMQFQPSNPINHDNTSTPSTQEERSDAVPASIAGFGQLESLAKPSNESRPSNSELHKAHNDHNMNLSENRSREHRTEVSQSPDFRITEEGSLGSPAWFDWDGIESRFRADMEQLDQKERNIFVEFDNICTVWF